MISRDTLEATDCHRALIGSATPTCRLTGAITYTAQYTGKDIAFAIQDISVGEFTLGNFANVLGHISMRRASPLAIHNLVVVIRVICIGGLHF